MPLDKKYHITRLYNIIGNMIVGASEGNLKKAIRRNEQYKRTIEFFLDEKKIPKIYKTCVELCKASFIPNFDQDRKDLVRVAAEKFRTIPNPRDGIVNK